MRTLGIIVMIFDFLENFFNILLVVLPIIGVLSFIAAYTSAVLFGGGFFEIGNSITRIVFTVWSLFLLIKILGKPQDF